MTILCQIPGNILSNIFCSEWTWWIWMRPVFCSLTSWLTRTLFRSDSKLICPELSRSGYIISPFKWLKLKLRVKSNVDGLGSKWTVHFKSNDCPSRPMTVHSGSKDRSLWSWTALFKDRVLSPLGTIHFGPDSKWKPFGSIFNFTLRLWSARKKLWKSMHSCWNGVNWIFW